MDFVDNRFCDNRCWQFHFDSFRLDDVLDFDFPGFVRQRQRRDRQIREINRDTVVAWHFIGDPNFVGHVDQRIAKSCPFRDITDRLAVVQRQQKYQKRKKVFHVLNLPVSTRKIRVRKPNKR